MKYFLIAGEASGDLHASNLMRDLRRTDPNAEFCFLGGDLMLAQGGSLVKHYRQMAFMGFVAVLRNLKTVLQNLTDCKNAIAAFNPDVVILIDYPSFNLRIARYVKENFNIPVFYYISPKIWVWKEYRIKDIKKYVDRMFCIFPFETEFYQKHNYTVDYVGNPTVDSVAELCNRNERFDEFCTKNNLPQKPIIALLPGSRKQEISACLHRMVLAARKFSNYQLVISGAPGIDAEFYNQSPELADIPVLFNQTYQLVLHSQAAVVNSGTATLETALISTPQVVVYHVIGGKLAIVAKSIFIKTKFISLVNIIAGKELVKELIAHLFTTQNVENELRQLLENKEYIDSLKSGYAEISKTLGETGTSLRAAKRMFEAIK
jgi:lipid-A-disaccharide synthase